MVRVSLRKHWERWVIMETNWLKRRTDRKILTAQDSHVEPGIDVGQLILKRHRCGIGGSVLLVSEWIWSKRYTNTPTPNPFNLATRFKLLLSHIHCKVSTHLHWAWRHLYEIPSDPHSVYSGSHPAHLKNTHRHDHFEKRGKNTVRTMC